ncbi:MAG: 2-oxoacid:acceptor oxidoreductase family protein [Anaerolineae bacterium]
MQLKLVIVGIGGQGVLFATHVLSEAALALDLEVIGAETHGMSQRGGSVISHLKVGMTGGPLVRRGTADAFLALDPDEGYKALGFLRDGAVGFVNTGRPDFPRPEIAKHLAERGIELHTLDADDIAMELGSPALANVALIGFALAHPAFPFRFSDIQETVTRVSKERFRASNLEALARGYAVGERISHLAAQPSSHPAIEPSGPGDEP